MTFITSLLSMHLSTLFMTLNTPLIMAAVITIQALLVSFSTYNIALTSWFSFILFLVFISAMMIIFVYVSSLASNEFFNSYVLTTGHHAMIMTMLFMLLLASPATVYANMFSVFSLTDMNLGPTSTYKMFTSYTLNISIILINYLLISLIAVAKISSCLKGPLRM
uniref:NADH dehydrogenase subunit 6 n=1 Tax=Gammarus fossarum TaxID=52638 RepID=A0A343CZQ8_9CRUS|nr:NADH dehydrogenase subunit 6 [Gammarus fossarum]ARQ82008.1 NADH dehydrogenase subunit 6 [Gammarus fossarum]